MYKPGSQLFSNPVTFYAFMLYYIIGIAMVNSVNDTIVREDNTTTITCEAFGYPPPTIVWNRMNKAVSDRASVSDSINIPTGYGNVTRVSVNLTIINASREDAGVYTCSVNNSIGSDNTNVNITVQCKYLIFSFSYFLMVKLCFKNILIITDVLAFMYCL